MSLTFYYTPHSNASRIRISLNELGVPHETVPVDLKAGDQKKPAFLANNPNGKVPTIVLDGTPVFESVAVQIALGERYGVEKGLWPRIGGAEHLQALTWLVWSQVSLASALIRRMQNTSSYVPEDQHNAKQAEAAQAEIQHLLGILDERLKDRAYLTGENIMLVDLDVAATIVWGMHVVKLDVGRFARVKEWLGRVSGRPSFREEMPLPASAA